MSDPVLHMDFARGLFVSPRIDFTRASAAWHWDLDSLLAKLAADEPRLQYDPADGTSLGLLVEVQRTNSLLDNRDLSTGNWTNSGISSKNETGLDGTANTAHTLTDDDGSSREFQQQSITVADNSNTHVWSVYFKKDSDTTRFPAIRCQLIGGTTQLDQVFQINTSDGSSSDGAGTAATDADSVSVKDAGDWWRLVVVMSNNSTGNTALSLRIHPAAGSSLGSWEVGATGSIVYDFGQVELNASFASSPIETGSSAVTVNADDASMPLPSELASGLVWVIHAKAPTAIDAGRSFVGGLDDGSTTNRLDLGLESPGGPWRITYTVGGVNVVNDTYSWVNNTEEFKLALKVSGSEVRMFVNGDSEVDETISTDPSGLTTKTIGNSIGSGSRWNSTIALDRMYANPGDWSDADLQRASA